MTANTSVLCIAALCLVHGIAGQIPSLQDVVADAFQKTQSTVAQSVARDGANQLQTIAHNLIIDGQQVVNNASTTLQSIADKLNDAVQKAIGNVPTCVSSQQAQVAQLLSNTTQNIWKCVTNDVDKVNLLITDVASLGAKAFLLPQQTAANITLCLVNPFTAVFCIAQAVGNWGIASESICNSIDADVRMGAQLFFTSPGDIASCAATEVDNAAASVQQIIVDIAQCVVNGSTSSNSNSTSSANNSTSSNSTSSG